MNQTRQKTNKPKNDEYSQLLDHYEQWLEYLKQSLMVKNTLFFNYFYILIYYYIFYEINLSLLQDILRIKMIINLLIN